MESADREIIAACGLFCTNCGALRRGKCTGCTEQPLFKRCPVRACCRERGIETCAACAEFPAPREFRECRTLHNWISRFFGLVFDSDRPGALRILRDEGRASYLAQKRASGKH